MRVRVCALWAILAFSAAVFAQADAPRPNGAKTDPADTVGSRISGAPGSTGSSVTESTTTSSEVVQCERFWDIDAPIRLRAADPQEPCTVQIFNTFDWSTSSDGTDDDFTNVTHIEWGFLANHELSLAVPVRIGDGGVEGNADITLGWQWRLWEERDLLPAFGLQNELRVPSGYQSEGVDWTLTGLITKTIIPDKMRVHANPFLKTVNGENLVYENSRNNNWRWREQNDPRHFQWGVILGMDYKITECLILSADYIHEASSVYGWRNQHTAETGLEWRFAENQTLGAAAYTTLDGDNLGPNHGLRFNYTYTFDYSQ